MKTSEAVIFKDITKANPGEAVPAKMLHNVRNSTPSLVIFAVAFLNGKGDRNHASRSESKTNNGEKVMIQLFLFAALHSHLINSTQVETATGNPITSLNFGS